MRITVKMFEDAVDRPITDFAHQCHAGSVALIRSGLIEGPARVARGTCRGVPGQHSWVVLGSDCYADNIKILDPTRWSYEDAEPHIWSGRGNPGPHRPHGYGDIVTYGKPTSSGGPAVELTPSDPLSASAKAFLRLLGPLDRRGWMALANAPVLGWPAAEIIAAMDDTKELRALVPIDKLGMLTKRNPGGLYLAPEVVQGG